MTVLRSARRQRDLALAAVTLAVLCGCGQQSAQEASSPLTGSASSSASSATPSSSPSSSSPSASTASATSTGTPSAGSDGVRITAPDEGQHLPAGVMGVVGTGTAPEGTLLWRITQADGTELDSGHTQAGANGEVGDFSIQQTVQKGTCQPCTVAVWVPDDSDGEGVPSAAVKRTFWVD